jgi:hypothetical protein
MNAKPRFYAKILTVTAPVLAGLIILVAAMLILSVVPARADGPNEATVIVGLGQNDVAARPITFAAASVSGLEALRLTGLAVITTDFGGGFIGICSIEGVGCPAVNCFCDPNRFWNYSYWDGSTWQGYPVGATSSSVTNGGIEGWAWGGWPTNPPPAPPITAALAGLKWLAGQQSTVHGGYGSQGNTAQAMLAVGANRHNPAAWRTAPANPSLLDYWSRTDFGSPSNAASFAAANAGRAGLLALAAAGAGETPQSFAGLNLVVSMTTFYSATIGAFDSANINQAWAILGHRAAGETVPAAATQHLVVNGAVTGGWEWGAGMGSDTNTTAVAMQALIAGGECITSPNITLALDFLKAAQKSDGGFAYNPFSSASDANSTAWVIQALWAAGKDPTATPWTVNGKSPVDYLLAAQLPNGSFEWQPGLGSNQLSTQQAIPALLGMAFPMHLDPPDQTQCTVSGPAQAPGDFFRQWLPLILK